MRVLPLMALLTLGTAGPAAAQVVPPSPPPVSQPPQQQPSPVSPAVGPDAPGTSTPLESGNTAGTRFVADERLRPPFGLKWKVALPIDDRDSPLRVVAAGGRVLVGGDAGVFAYDGTTGRLLWKAKEGTSGIALAGDLVITTPFRRVRALDVATGAVRWTTAIEGDSVTSAPLVRDDRIWVPKIQRVSELDRATGRVLRELPDVGPLGGTLAVAGQRIFVGGACRIASVDLATNRGIWAGTARGCIEKTGDVVLTGSHAVTRTTTLRASDGRTAGPATSASVVLGDLAVGPAAGQSPFGTDVLVARSVPDGRERWRRRDLQAKLEDRSSLLGTPGGVLFGDAGRLIALSSTDGRTLWEARLPAFADALAADGGTLFVAGNGALHALSSAVADPLPRLGKLQLEPVVEYGTVVQATVKLEVPGIRRGPQLEISRDEQPFGSLAGARRIGPGEPGWYVAKFRPERTTRVRIALSDGSARSDGSVVVLPRVRVVRLRRATPTLRATVRVPRSVKLRGRRLHVYVARAGARRYDRIGGGTLTAGRPARSTFGFRPVPLGRKDFVVFCVPRLYRQGLGYGDRLDRRCGARSVRFG